MTQFRSDRNFIPEEFHNLFGCRRFRNYSSVIASAKNCRLTISVIPPPMIGEFYTTQKKCKTLSWPTSFIQHIHMYIGYGEWVSLQGHCYIITLVNQATCYVFTRGMHALSWSGVIQELQWFWLVAVRLQSKFYTDLENRMIRGASQIWVLDNRSKIVDAPAVH